VTIGLSPEVFLNTIIQGILLGGLYALISLGLSITFGLLDVVNFAHFGFLVIGGYLAYLLNLVTGVDPIVAGLLLSPFFFVLGCSLYKVTGRALTGVGGKTTSFVFLFAMLIILEMIVYTVRGVTEFSVYTAYTMESLHVGAIWIPLRLFYPFVASLILIASFYLFLTKTLMGLAMRALALDEQTLLTFGCNTDKVKMILFGLSVMVGGIAGGLILAIQPMNSFAGRIFVPIAFAIVILGGVGNVLGTLIGGFVLGVSQNLASLYFGPLGAQAVCFSLIIVLLLVKPTGILRR
jgi:branched-chain amino acid transport system permease protein